MKNKFTTIFTRREADLYRSHGLLEVAQHLYQQALDESTPQGPGLAGPLQEKIGQLEKELTEVEIDIAEVVSERELSILRESWGDTHAPADIGICASALRSIGLYNAAIEEYGKLVRLGRPQAEYIEGLTDCIITVYAPQTIGTAIENIVVLFQPPEAHPTSLRIGIAVELARRGLDQPALALLQSASAIGPLPERIKKFVKKITQRLEKDAGSTASDDLSSPVKEKGAARQRKDFLTNYLASLQKVIYSRFFRAS